MTDERCSHGLNASVCGDCRLPPPGVPRMVWITERGNAFHRRPNCEALLAGQGRAERRGQRTHEPRNVAYSVAIADGRGPCLQCFPEQIPADAKPCWVRVENRSMKGWLLDWSRGNDHRWKGKVIYIDMGRGVQVTTVKDQSDLEDRAPGTNEPGRTGR